MATRGTGRGRSWTSRGDRPGRPLLPTVRSTDIPILRCAGGDGRVRRPPRFGGWTHGCVGAPTGFRRAALAGGGSGPPRPLPLDQYALRRSVWLPAPPQGRADTGSVSSPGGNSGKAPTFLIQRRSSGKDRSTRSISHLMFHVKQSGGFDRAQGSGARGGPHRSVHLRRIRSTGSWTGSCRRRKRRQGAGRSCRPRPRQTDPPGPAAGIAPTRQAQGATTVRGGRLTA